VNATNSFLITQKDILADKHSKSINNSNFYFNFNLLNLFLLSKLVSHK